jgi:hypothetical protein
MDGIAFFFVKNNIDLNPKTLHISKDVKVLPSLTSIAKHSI